MTPVFSRLLRVHRAVVNRTTDDNQTRILWDGRPVDLEVKPSTNRYWNDCITPSRNEGYNECLPEQPQDGTIGAEFKSPDRLHHNLTTKQASRSLPHDCVHHDPRRSPKSNQSQEIRMDNRTTTMTRTSRLNGRGGSFLGSVGNVVTFDEWLNSYSPK